MVFKAHKQKINSNSKKSGIIKRIIKKSIFPASTIALFGITVCYWNNQDYGLALEYKGETVATMSNDKVYEQANHMIIDQFNSEDKSKIKTSSAQVKIKPVKKSECCESPSQIKDKIIEKQSGETFSQAFGVYVNGKLIAIGSKEDEINDILQKMISSAQSQNEGCKAEFREKVEIKKGLFTPEKIQNIEDIKSILTDGNVKFLDYVVSSEDTVVGIAEKFGIDPEELLKLNGVKKDEVAVGDKLKIKTIEKILNLRIFKVVAEEKEIPYSTETTEDPSKETPFKEVTQEGKNGKGLFTYEIEYSNSEETSRKEINRDVYEEPVTEKIVVGTKKISQKSEFLWPVPFTRKITSPYGNRDGGFHKGIDISCHGVYGTAIVASESGTVKIAKYGNKGYGNYIVVDHGKGKQTLYAHCKELFVKPGQKVSKGDKLGSVGSTGDSTGAHLHFEIIIDGKSQNPQNYV